MEIKLALLENSYADLECIVFKLDLADMVTLVDWSGEHFKIQDELTKLTSKKRSIYSLKDVDLEEIAHKKELIFKFIESTREQIDYVFPAIKGIRPQAPFKYKAVSGAIVAPVEIEVLDGRGLRIEVSKHRKMYVKDPEKAKESREAFLNEAGQQALTPQISDVHIFRSARERRLFFNYYSETYDFFVPSEEHNFAGFVKRR